MNLLVNAASLDLQSPRGLENYAIGIIRGLSHHVGDIYVNVQASNAPAARREFATLDRVHVVETPDRLTPGWRFQSRRALPFRLLRRARIEVVKAYRARRLRRLIEEASIDALFNPEHLSPCERIGDLPTLSTVHRVLMTYTEREIRIAKGHVEKANAVVCCWPVPYDELTEFMPAHAHKVARIPYLADHLLVTPDLSVREHHDLPERFFFYPAVAIPRKNHRSLIEAYGVAKSRGVELPHLVCSGGFVDDAYEDELRGLIAELGLGGHIRFIGHVSNAEMAGLYALCTAGVSSSLNEAGMAVIQEAGYLRRPVVCSNTPEAMTQAALYGWRLPMFDPTDPEDIARVLEGFIAEEPRHIAEANQAAEMIRAYSGEVIGQRYAELFHWICGKTDRPEWHPFA